MPRGPVYPSTETKARILERIEAGWTLQRLEAEPGFPSAPTVRSWARRDPAFAALLVSARRWRRTRRFDARMTARVFRPAWAEEFITRIRRGQMVASLIGGPGQPSRAIVRQWRRERPEFDMEVSAAVRLWRGHHRGQRPYDEAVADRIVLMLSHGATIDEVFAQPELPGRQIVGRWRRRVPEFDGAVRIALGVGWRARCLARRGDADETLTEAICLHVLDGGSLRSAARSVPGAPSQVTLYAWATLNPDFARGLQIARQMRDEMKADRALMIVENLAEAARTGVAPPSRFARRGTPPDTTPL